jgi:hypothetical protein
MRWTVKYLVGTVAHQQTFFQCSDAVKFATVTGQRAMIYDINGELTYRFANSKGTRMQWMELTGWTALRYPSAK